MIDGDCAQRLCVSVAEGAGPDNTEFVTSEGVCPALSATVMVVVSLAEGCCGCVSSERTA